MRNSCPPLVGPENERRFCDEFRPDLTVWRSCPVLASLLDPLTLHYTGVQESLLGPSNTPNEHPRVRPLWRS